MKGNSEVIYTGIQEYQDTRDQESKRDGIQMKEGKIFIVK